MFSEIFEKLAAGRKVFTHFHDIIIPKNVTKKSLKNYINTKLKQDTKDVLKNSVAMGTLGGLESAVFTKDKRDNVGKRFSKGFALTAVPSAMGGTAANLVLTKNDWKLLNKHHIADETLRNSMVNKMHHKAFGKRYTPQNVYKLFSEREKDLADMHHRRNLVTQAANTVGQLGILNYITHKDKKENK
jgi:hypothetical protein